MNFVKYILKGKKQIPIVNERSENNILGPGRNTYKIYFSSMAWPPHVLTV